MREREIFLKALEADDAVARRAYLDTACAGRPALRNRVEALLRSHAEADTFLDVPAMEQMAAPERELSFLEPAADPDAIGRLDHYDVLAVVGRGSTGIVLKARDTKLQRVVAIKALAPRLAASPAACGRFVREAQAAAAVRDDHVVAIHAVNDDGPVPYLVMEFIGGITLEDRVRRSGPLDLKEVLRIGSQVAMGLAAAHAQGLAHRDVKPANIMLENGVERVKITDFGLARAADDVPTAPGTVAGTPAYMSPEQARGEPGDCRSDLFSLGSVLYALCAGHSPFHGDTMAATLRAVRDNTPPPLGAVNPRVPDWLGAVVARLQATNPSDRFGSAIEVADLLGSRLAEVQQGTPASPIRRTKLTRWLLGAIVIGLLSFAALLAVWKPWRPADAGRRREAAPQAFEPIELRRADVPPHLLALAGGDAAPAELVAVLGDGRFLLPRVGETSWMEQSPDGTLLAVPLDGDVVLFDMATATPQRTLTGPGGRVIYLTFSRDGRSLAACTMRDETGEAVRVWDLADDRVRFTQAQPGRAVGPGATFSADGRHLFTEADGRVRVWETGAGKPAGEVAIEETGLGRLSMSPDGRRLAVTVCFGHRVEVFDWDGARLTPARTLTGLADFVASVAYSPDGSLLATGDSRQVRLWDARTLEPVRTLPTPAVQLAFTPDGRTLYASSTVDQARATYPVTRWDVGTGKELPALPVTVAADPVRAFTFLSRDGKALFVIAQHGASHVRVYDTATKRELHPRAGHTAPVNAVAVSPNGRLVASAGDDWTIHLWDAAARSVRHTLTAQAGAIWGLAFSPDGRLLASGSRDGTIAVWDTETGGRVRSLHGHSRAPSRISFSPDGEMVAAGGEAGEIKLWDLDEGLIGRSVPARAGPVRCVALSPGGSLLASGGDDRTVRVQNRADRTAREFAVPWAVNELAFGPSGKALAAAGDGPKPGVRVWDLATGAETTLAGHAGPVHGLAFSPTTRMLATGGDDDTVRLWDPAAGGTLLKTIGPGPFGGGVRSVAFTPDGRYLATANANGLVYLLDVSGGSTSHP